MTICISFCVYLFRCCFFCSFIVALLRCVVVALFILSLVFFFAYVFFCLFACCLFAFVSLASLASLFHFLLASVFLCPSLFVCLWLFTCACLYGLFIVVLFLVHGLCLRYLFFCVPFVSLFWSLYCMFLICGCRFCVFTHLPLCPFAFLILRFCFLMSLCCFVYLTDSSAHTAGPCRC